MNEPLFELFLSRATMLDAERELLCSGENAVPMLEALLSGQAKNRFGVPYRQLGMPLRCALEVAIRLGPIAKPLEPYLRHELRSGSHVAARALGALGSLEAESISDLASSLSGDLDLSFEAAAALVQCGEAAPPLVLEVISKSEAAAAVLKKAGKYLVSRGGGNESGA